MGILANLRGSRTQEAGLPVSDGSSSSNSSVLFTQNKKKFTNFLPFFIILVVIVEICFLGRLDMAHNAGFVDWADSFFYNRNLGFGGDDLQEVTSDVVLKNDKSFEIDDVVLKNDKSFEIDSCEEWLEKEDSIAYSRDFDKEPVLVIGAEKEWNTCAVGCHFGFDRNRKPDATFGVAHQDGTANVLRSMESSQYYAENNIALARRRGFNIVMTTSLSSDVPAGYFSWAEYDIMAPVQPKTEKALAAAFISNCGARNFRLQALEELEKAKIPIDSYGGCHRNRNGRVDKVETLKRYKFSLAFENSNEEDYVTEKFFQSLVAGNIPVVIGAPNIQDFAPGPGSILHIKELEDVDAVAKSMKYLSENPDAYNQSLRWKYEGPSDSFKALLDMAAVHSSCRLCIHLATVIREKEERSLGSMKRPCKCSRGSETTYHLYVRERGRFEMESIFLRSRNLTLKALESEVLNKFKSMKHRPIWKPERPEIIRGGDDYKVYRIYPVGMTQRQALYTFKFESDADFQNHLETNPCPKFEVIFV